MVSNFTHIGIHHRKCHWDVTLNNTVRHLDNVKCLKPLTHFASELTPHKIWVINGAGCHYEQIKFNQLGRIRSVSRLRYFFLLLVNTKLLRSQLRIFK